MNNMISDAQFWWNHLTFQQQCFIRYRLRRALDPDINQLTEEELPSFAFKHSASWSTYQGWPETQLRKI